MKRDIPIMVTLITGIFLVITFFIPHKPFGAMETLALLWFAIVAGFTMIIGLDSLLGIHVKKIIKHQAGWGYSLLLIFGFLVTIITGVQSGIRYHTPFELGSSFMFIYTYFIVPLQGTMFSLLAFFIASASFRAFRARSFSSTLLLVAATIVMLGRVPGGEQISHWLPVVSEWIMNVPQLAAKRGILVGSYLGAAAISLRILLGIERPYLS